VGSVRIYWDDAGQRLVPDGVETILSPLGDGATGVFFDIGGSFSGLENGATIGVLRLSGLAPRSTVFFVWGGWAGSGEIVTLGTFFPGCASGC